MQAKKKKSAKEMQQGFTLIEALVATFLFAIVMASVTDVYLSTVKVNRRTDTIRTASESARFIVESMTKEIRNGQIDYFTAISPCSNVPASPAYSLAILSSENDRICFFVGNNNGQLSSSGTSLWLVKNNLSPVKVNGTGVNINGLKFYVAPTYNPYNTGSNISPRVTIAGSVQVTSGGQDNVVIPIQTTISIPVYDIAPGP